MLNTIFVMSCITVAQAIFHVLNKRLWFGLTHCFRKHKQHLLVDFVTIILGIEADGISIAEIKLTIKLEGLFGSVFLKAGSLFSDCCGIH